MPRAEEPLFSISGKMMEQFWNSWHPRTRISRSCDSIPRSLRLISNPLSSRDERALNARRTEANLARQGPSPRNHRYPQSESPTLVTDPRELSKAIGRRVGAPILRLRLFLLQGSQGLLNGIEQVFISSRIQEPTKRFLRRIFGGSATTVGAACASNHCGRARNFLSSLPPRLGEEGFEAPAAEADCHALPLPPPPPHPERSPWRSKDQGLGMT